MPHVGGYGICSSAETLESCLESGSKDINMFQRLRNGPTSSSGLVCRLRYTYGQFIFHDVPADDLYFILTDASFSHSSRCRKDHQEPEA